MVGSLIRGLSKWIWSWLFVLKVESFGIVNDLGVITDALPFGNVIRLKLPAHIDSN